jgi:hypothetical protein
MVIDTGTEAVAEAFLKFRQEGGDCSRQSRATSRNGSNDSCKKTGGPSSLDAIADARFVRPFDD